MKKFPCILGAISEALMIYQQGQDVGSNISTGKILGLRILEDVLGEDLDDWLWCLIVLA